MTESATTYKELQRSSTDRMVAGVCGGLGRYFDVNPAFYRIGFVVLTLLGGAGILIYFAALLVMPNEGEKDSVASGVLRDHRQQPWALVALGVFAVAALSILSHASLWPHGDAAWILLIVAALIILVARRRERGARPRILRAVLIVLGSLIALMFTLAAVTASVLSIHVRNGIGKRDYAPATLTSLASSYKLGIGDLRLDVHSVPFPVGETTIDLNNGVGKIDVIVPANVVVRVVADADYGKITAFDHTSDGHDVNVETTNTAGSGERRVLIKAHVGAGRIDIYREG